MSESKTPRTDAAAESVKDAIHWSGGKYGVVIPSELGRELESELYAAHARIAELESERGRLRTLLAGLQETYAACLSPQMCQAIDAALAAAEKEPR